MKHRRLLPLSLTIALALMAPVASSSGEPTAVSAKKKCKKALWKCAPKRYHLSVTGRSGPQTYSAEVELEKNRSNFARVDYSQRGGKITLSTTYEGVPYEIDMCSNARFVVSEATTQVPRAGIFGSFDFAVFFYLDLEKRKWRYSVLGGGVYSELTFPGTVTCLEGDAAGVSAPFTYYLHGPLGVGSGPADEGFKGRPGASRLSGSDTYGSKHALNWKLTK
jgi:hypothetical protein